MTATLGHNSNVARSKKYTASEIDAAIRTKIRSDNIRPDSNILHRAKWELWLSRLSPRAKLVGLAIWEHADKDGTKAFPSMQRLLVMVGGSKRDLTAAIEEFSAWEFSEVVPGTGKRSNEYRFILTLQDLSDHIGGDNVVVPLRPRDGTTRTLSSTTVVPASSDFSSTTVVPQETVVVPSDPRSGTTAPISTRASYLLDLKREEEGDTQDRVPAPRDRMIGRVAAAIATGIAATSLPVAAAPIDPPAQIRQEVAECWQTPRARMDAETNIHEKRAQRQVWRTPTGVIEVTGEFRDELLKEYPLVDLKCGLSTSAPNVKIGHGAIISMQDVRRAFGYMQQDALRKQRPSTALAQTARTSWEDEKREREDEWLVRDIAASRARKAARRAENEAEGIA